VVVDGVPDHPRVPRPQQQPRDAGLITTSRALA
jgi:hypothetical protein